MAAARARVTKGALSGNAGEPAREWVRGLCKVDLLVQRQLADAFSRGGEDGVGKRRSGRWNRGLADSADGAAVVDRSDLDRRRLVETQALERMKVGLFGHSVLVGQFAIDGVAQSPDHAALNLVLEIFGVEHFADLGRNEHLVDLDTARRVGHLNDLGDGHTE